MLTKAAKQLEVLTLRQDHLYYGLVGTCLLFTFLNNAAMKYNSSVWCSDPINYAFLVKKLEDSSATSYQSWAHYLMTLVNAVNYVVVCALVFKLCHIYG